jgi:hypothetical protein
LDLDSAIVGCQYTGNRAQERTLAGPVRPDERKALTGVDLDVYGPKRPGRRAVSTDPRCGGRDGAALTIELKANAKAHDTYERSHSTTLAM